MSHSAGIEAGRAEGHVTGVHNGFELGAWRRALLRCEPLR